MFIRMTRSTGRKVLPLALLATLGACGSLERIADIGKAPTMTAIQNPRENPAYKPVSMPMPPVTTAKTNPNSLWKAGSRAFFKDQRAARVGDILTIVVAISDSAGLSNSTSRTRSNTETTGINGLFGAENLLGKVFSDGATGANAVDLSSATNNAGTGKVDRAEKINLQVAAVITQRLPNGNLVLFGRQEVRVNFEVRELVVGGIIRPEDILSNNTISYAKMAEARISYGGRGQLTDMQQPRYGSQVLDIVLPF